MSPVAGWVVMTAIVVLGGALLVTRDSRRRAGQLDAPPASVTWLKVAVMAIAGVVLVLIGNTNRGAATAVRGVPWVVLAVLVVVTAWSCSAWAPRRRTSGPPWCCSPPSQSTPWPVAAARPRSRGRG